MKGLFRIVLLLTALSTLASCGGSSHGGATSASTTVGSTAPSHTTRDTTPIFPEVTPMESFETYQNPLLDYRDENAWEGYGFGDPFVMRFNGIYYLYVSTLDGQVGIRCWSSPDLVNWSYEGYCATDERTRGAYAPEVYYYNGFFYMYTSPAGNGHYVLKSSSPTEGFEVVTDNMGMSIDGSVFIDNDGSWYFYTAGSGAIRVYDMDSPSSMGTERIVSSASVNGGWTEGSMVVYHDGYYYMTYTGNHVLSPSYRILYGVSDSSPTKFKAMPEHNPLLINTSEDVLGIGHSSTVKGPDLDSYYIVYHALLDLKPNRTMNIDRIVFNGERMEVIGPTVTPQQVPDLPDVYRNFTLESSLEGWTLTGSLGSADNGLCLGADSLLVSEHTFEGDFTAEYNLTSVSPSATAGAVFAYTDPQNFGACLFSPALGQVIIELTEKGVTTQTAVDTVRSFGEATRFDCVQSLQIERKGGDYTFYMNDRLLCTLTSEGLKGGAIGYMTRGGEATLGFIGGTAAVGGYGGADAYKTVSSIGGFIPAYENTEGLPTLTLEQGQRAVLAEEGDILSYRILPSEGGSYDLAALCYGDEASEVTLEVYVDGRLAGSCDLSAVIGRPMTAIIRSLTLPQGPCILSLRLAKGSLRVESLTVRSSAEVSELGSPVYTDGGWTVSDTSLSVDGPSFCGKILYGSPNWGDYEVELTVTPKDLPSCDLLVRVTNPGNPAFLGQTPDPVGGIYWMEGYSVELTPERLILAKQSYGREEVAGIDMSFSADTSYVLKVVCRGAEIVVYLDGELMLTYTDPEPFMQGMVGMRSQFCSAEFSGLSVRPCP